MGRFPEVGRNYVAYLYGRICFLSGKIDALTAGSAERKVAQYLLSRLEGGWVELDCSAAGLARRLGVSRASQMCIRDRTITTAVQAKRSGVSRVILAR